MSNYSEEPPTRGRKETAGEDELLAFLDGELTAERQAEIRQLCETDWETRTRMARVQRRIEKYVEATAHHSPNNFLPFEDFWLRLSPQLKEGRSSGEATVKPQEVNPEDDDLPSLMSRLADRFTWQPLRLRMVLSLTATLIVIAGAIYIFNVGRLGAVSAQELLQLSAQAEIGRANQVVEPVVYRRLRMRRRSKGEIVSLAWESWDDPTRNRFKLRVPGAHPISGNEPQTPALLAEFEGILTQNRMDAHHPLSAANYARWREQAKLRAENVAEVTLPDSPREIGLKLTTMVEGPHAPGSIIEASLIVRRSDWHPVAQSLKVQGENEIREYELGELAYGVLPSQALSVFADSSPVVAATPSASPSRNAVLASSPVPNPSPLALPSAADLMEAETAALYALHQAQADLGEQIEVLREADRQIVVQGLVETDARKQQLAEALGEIPLLVVKIQSVEEVVRQAAKQTKPEEVISTDDSTSVAAPRRSPFEQLLAQYFMAQGESRKGAELRIVEFSNSVMAGSSAMLSQAWALRRLAERFSNERELTPAARARVEEMLGHHLTGLKDRLQVLRRRLEPPLTGMADGSAAPPTPAPEADWQAQALSVFKAVERVHKLAGRLFATGDGASGVPTHDARQILHGVAQLDGALQLLARQNIK